VLEGIIDVPISGISKLDVVVLNDVFAGVDVSTGMGGLLYVGATTRFCTLYNAEAPSAKASSVIIVSTVNTQYRAASRLIREASPLRQEGIRAFCSSNG
jgi:hypothetical protein